MIISLVVAMDRNRLIGRNQQLPWHLPADLRHFKEITMGKPILMGRKTWESIGRPLPGRTNVVVTASADFQAPGCIVTHSIEEALAAVGEDKEVMVIGGAHLYRQLLPRADRIYLTLVDHAFAGDTWFPELDERDWKECCRHDHDRDQKNPYRYSFVQLQRR
jgi:dihydrofolate reductase